MYTYHKPLAQGATSWECVKRRHGHCKARVKLTATDDFIEAVHEHRHPPSDVLCEVAKVKAGVKRRAETTNERTQQVLAGELMGVSEGAAANLPPLSNMRRTIRSQRQTNENLPPNPVRRGAIPILPAAYQTISTGEQFLLYDSGVGDAERIFIFGSPQATCA